VSAAAEVEPPAGDPGLFGPTSVTWRVQSDPSMAVAGLRSLLLEALHPVALAGVVGRSDFRADPWGRLIRTAEYVGLTSFGSTEEAERAGARVRAIHRRLSEPAPVDPVTGRRFRLDDPDLLRWIHVAETESFLTVARKAGLRLTGAEADRYYVEQRVSARLIGLDPASVPGSRAEVAAYYTAMRPELQATKHAREVARFVVVPPMPTWVATVTPARLAWAGLSGAAFALLPGWARRMYRLPGLPVTEWSAALAVRGLRAGVNALPESRREGPHRKAARERLGLETLLG